MLRFVRFLLPLQFIARSSMITTIVFRVSESEGALDFYWFRRRIGDSRRILKSQVPSQEEEEEKRRFGSWQALLFDSVATNSCQMSARSEPFDEMMTFRYVFTESNLFIMQTMLIFADCARCPGLIGLIITKDSESTFFVDKRLIFDAKQIESQKKERHFLREKKA